MTSGPLADPVATLAAFYVGGLLLSALAVQPAARSPGRAVIAAVGGLPASPDAAAAGGAWRRGRLRLDAHLRGRGQRAGEQLPVC